MPYVTGTILDQAGAPAQRQVCVYHRATGHLVGKTISDAVTGEYQRWVATDDEVTVIAYDTATVAPLLNDAVIRVVPGGADPISDWETGSSEGIPEYVSSLFVDDLARSHSDFGSLATTNAKWRGGVLSPNGNIYGIPFSSTSILKIDPVGRSATTFGNISGNFKWAGGVLAPNGKIYGIPFYATTVLEINPSNDTTSTFGSLSSDVNKWSGGVLAPNGKIYGVPSNAQPVLEIDPVGQSVSTFGGPLSGYSGGVLAPNGKIYCIPESSTTVLEIDPVLRTVDTFGALPAGTKWRGGVLAPNGKIYGIPANTTTVLEIDPVLRTVDTFGDLPVFVSKWMGGVLAPNGKIYGIPYGGATAGEETTTILEIDPTAKTANTFGAVPNWDAKWAGGVLAPNGKIYGVPYGSHTSGKQTTKVLEISFSPDPSARVNLNLLLNAGLNKF